MKKQPKVISLDYLLNLVKQQEAKDMIIKQIKSGGPPARERSSREAREAEA